MINLHAKLCKSIMGHANTIKNTEKLHSLASSKVSVMGKTELVILSSIMQKNHFPLLIRHKPCSTGEVSDACRREKHTFFMSFLLWHVQ